MWQHVISACAYCAVARFLRYQNCLLNHSEANLRAICVCEWQVIRNPKVVANGLSTGQVASRTPRGKNFPAFGFRDIKEPHSPAHCIHTIHARHIRS